RQRCIRDTNRLKNPYRGIRALILDKINSLPFEKRIIETGGGLHLTVHLPGFASDNEIKAAAEKRGIRLKCISDYLIKPAEGYERIAVINYSSVEEGQLK
ncbi:MAG: hypothetical protein K2N14_02030, partial [Clostridia bacterium]|nr:hypothetical protein [Clostridia bacterium]